MQAALSTARARSPLASFEVEPASHAFIVHIAVREVAVAAFGPKPPTKPKKSYISAETAELIDLRRRALVDYNWSERLVKLAPLRTTATAWAYGR